MKIAVLGAGSLGSAIGAALARAGSDVTLVARSREHVAAIQARGLVVHDQAGEHTVHLGAAVDCRGLAPVDLVIVLVKSNHTREALSGITPLLGPDTVLLSLQNGLGHEDEIAAVVGRQRVLAGKTYVGGILRGPGVVGATTVGKQTIIGELDGSSSARAQAIADEFNRAGLATTVSTNILGTIWDKLLVNCATGALSGITGLAYGDLYAVPELEATAVAAVAEAMAVARASGVTLGISEPVQAWRMAGAGLPASFKASILQTLERGKHTEIDFINGAVVRQGERVGVPTPVNRALVACIKGIERRLLAGQGAQAA